MGKGTTAVKKVGRATRSTLNKQRLQRLRQSARLKDYLTAKEYRKQCAIGLAEFRTMAFEELHVELASFAFDQWQGLRSDASQWERGQVDGLFWALDKLDEAVNN